MNIVIINRWFDEFSYYNNYISHEANNISYITHPAHVSIAKKSGAKYVFSETVFSYEHLKHHLNKIINKFNHIDTIIALSEFDLLNAAKCREYFSIKGDSVKNVMKFCDKPFMKKVVKSHGIRVPHFITNLKQYTSTDIINEVGLPLILKPKKGAASQGVKLIFSMNDLIEKTNDINLDLYQVEEYIEGPIFHIDGIFLDKQPWIISPSKYINTCLDFTKSKPLGSVTLDEGDEKDSVINFSSNCLNALGLKNSPFHLEIIKEKDGYCFLEIGARVGGGEIPYIFKEIHGVDLFETWINLLEGKPLNGKIEIKKSTGFLLVPGKKGKKLKACEFGDLMDECYYSEFHSKDMVFNSTDAFSNLMAKFRFSSTSCNSIATSIKKIIDSLVYEYY